MVGLVTTLVIISVIDTWGLVSTGWNWNGWLLIMGTTTVDLLEHLILFLGSSELGTVSVSSSKDGSTSFGKVRLVIDLRKSQIFLITIVAFRLVSHLILIGSRIFMLSCVSCNISWSWFIFLLDWSKSLQTIINWWLGTLKLVSKSVGCDLANSAWFTAVSL